MSNPNYPTQSQNDAKYATPASVSSAIAAQATTDAGQYLSKWQSNTTYVQGSVTLNTTGQVVSAVDNHTSSGSYDPSHWLTIAPPALGTIDGSRAAFVGDSLTSGNYYDIYANHLARSSNGRIKLQTLAGHGGWTSTMLLAVLQTEVFSQNPSVVFALIGRNDNTSYGEVIPPETVTYLEAIRTGCASRSIPLVLVGQPPNGSAALGTPSSPVATSFTTGGTMAAGTYGYKVSWGTSGGETLPSPAVTATVTGSTGSVRVDFPYSTGASVYKVYRETTAGSGTYALIATITNGSGAFGVQANKSWLDTGSVSPSGAPASSDGSANGLDTPNLHKQTAISHYLSKYARKWGLLYADISSVLLDITTGLYTTGYSGDGTHPSPIGARLMGESVWAQVGSYFRTPSAVRARSNNDPSNRFTNPLLLTGTGSPTGWTKSINTGTGTTPTLTSLAGFTGQAFTIGISDGISVQEWMSPVTTPALNDSKTAVNSGEIIEWSCRVKVVGADAGGGSFYVNLMGSNGLAYSRTGFATDGSGILSGSFVSDGVINFQLQVGVRNGPIQVSVGELSLVNLTRTSTNTLAA